MTDAPTHPPSPAQRILDQVESLRDMLVGEPLANNGKYDYCEWCHRYDKGDGKVVHSDSCSWVLSSRDFDTALATVRAALKEMEGGVEAAYEKGKAHGFHEGNNFRFMQDAEEDADESPEGDPLMLAKAHLRDDAVRIEQLESEVNALKAERARAVAKMEALKIDSGYKNIVIPGIQDVNCAIDACIKVLKGDQA